MEYRNKDKVEAAKALLEEAGVPFKAWTPETAQEWFGREVPEWALWDFLNYAEYEGLTKENHLDRASLAVAYDMVNENSDL